MIDFKLIKVKLDAIQRTIWWMAGSFVGNSGAICLPLLCTLALAPPLAPPLAHRPDQSPARSHQ